MEHALVGNISNGKPVGLGSLSLNPLLPSNSVKVSGWLSFFSRTTLHKLLVIPPLTLKAKSSRPRGILELV